MRRPKFTPATRYPADPRAVFVLVLCIISGVGQVIVSSTPPSIRGELPTWGVLVWGVGLLGAALLTLAGMARQTNGGIVAEQVGSAVMGAATLFYVAVAIFALGWDALTMPVGMILGWGLSCFWRWGQLQSLIHQTLVARGAAELERVVVARVQERLDGV